jgi:hypothetical protein
MKRSKLPRDADGIGGGLPTDRFAGAADVLVERPAHVFVERRDSGQRLSLHNHN